MRYTLITSSGKVMQFFIEEVAKTYQSIYGGVVVTDEIVNTLTDRKVVDQYSV